MRYLNVFLAVLVSVVLGVLVFEGGLRLFPAFRPTETINRFDPELGWSKKPDAKIGRSTSEFDITFETNDDGLRDDTPKAKQPSTFRVLMLGDSFVLGYTVDRKNLFVDELETWWQAEGRRVDVVNAGTEGYATDQEVLWFEENGAAYAPDLVLLFPYENDIYWNGQEKYTRFPKPRYRPDGTLEKRELTDPGPRSWFQHTAIGNLYAKEIAPKLARSSGPPPNHFQPAGQERWIYDEFAPLFVHQPPFLDDALARTKGSLLALERRCRELGARLLMVPIPSESAIQEDERQKFQETVLHGIPADAWSPDRPVDLFLGLGRDLGIETIDVRKKLRMIAEDGGEPLYFAQEWHFNPRGNETFAEILHEELDARGVFPADHSAITEVTLDPVPAHEGGVPTWLWVFGGLWGLLGVCYAATYRDEKPLLAFLKVGGLLALVFAIVLGGGKLLALAPPSLGPWLLIGFAVAVLGFVAYKLGRRIATITELIKAFTLRGHWYLMPLVVVLLSIGSLLVVAASSPLIAPFIYTLF